MIRLPTSLLSVELSALRYTVCVLVFALLSATQSEVAALEFSPKRLSESDLEIAFAVTDTPSKFISRAALLDAGSSEQSVLIPYIDDEVPSLVIPLKELALLAGATEKDTITAESYDGYFSVFQPEFIEKYAPYVVLDLVPTEPGVLKIGKSPNLGPYYITYEKTLKQGSPEYLDPDNKRPYGVNKITIGVYETIFAKLYAGPLAQLDAVADTGREIFINNCMSCHAWEMDGLGGRFSNRIVPILSVHAKYNAEYFKNYVYNPSQFLPDVLMPAHPHYDDAKIESIIAFLKEVPGP